MGKPARWLKNVLLGKKSSKSSASKDKERTVVTGKEEVVISKIEDSDVVSDFPSVGNSAVYTSGMVETQKLDHDDVSDDEIQISEVQPTNSQHVASVPDDLISEPENIQQEIAAVTVQAAYRGYLARRAFRILKGIIRLQALFRGHMVRRQAVSTLCCVMGIVRLQALARGREIRHSDIGVEVHRKCQLYHQPLENKLATSAADKHAYLGIKKLTANAFALKLLASSPNVMPLHLDNDSANSIWLENWSASCFWKPVPQPKNASVVRKTQKKFASNSQIVEAEFARPKKSIRKVPTSSQEHLSVAQTPFEFEKPKRSFRKVPTNQSAEPLLATKNPQVDLEKVKRGLRKVHNPVVENSIQPQPEPQIAFQKPSPGTKESVNGFDRETEDEMDETVVEQDDVLLQSLEPLGAIEALDSTLVNQMEERDENVMAEEKEDAKEERTPKQNLKENSARKENQKSGKKGSLVTTTQTAEYQESSNGNHTSSPGIPSYMQATKSAKAKLRLQGSSSPKQQETNTEKASKRYSLPSSGTTARVTSHSPKTRVSSSGGKPGLRPGNLLFRPTEGNGKTAPAEWKR